MASTLYTLGYEFVPTKYTPQLGYAQLSTVISSRQSERYFDVKAIHLTTFDGKFIHRTAVTRHELSPEETFQVCLGQVSLESNKGESLRAFSFGGMLKTTLVQDDLVCHLTSDAPIFRLQDEPKAAGAVIADELMEWLAIEKAKLTGHEDELYTKLASFSPYQVFLACLITLKNRADAVPKHLRHDSYYTIASDLHRAFRAIEDTDGWDGQSPSIEDLLGSAGASQAQVP